MRINRREFLKAAGAGACLTGIDSLSAFAASNHRPNVVLRSLNGKDY